jgi:hypothetical protein
MKNRVDLNIIMPSNGGADLSAASCVIFGTRLCPRGSSAADLSVVIRTTTETQRVQFPSRKSEMLCLVRDMSSKTADVPSPSGDWALIPTQIDAG